MTGSTPPRSAAAIGVDLGAGLQAEPAEEPLLAGGELAIGQLERGGDRVVLGPHLCDPVLGRGQLGGQIGGRPGGTVFELPGHHGDRQRQISAQRDHLDDTAVSWSKAGTAGEAGEQLRGLTGLEDVQSDRDRVLEGGEPAAAGDQHQAAARAGQQWPHLVATGRIVQQ